jgi:hypothetical protein
MSFLFIPHPPTTKSRYCRQLFVVPNTKKATSEAVTPGMNRTISEIVLETEKLGAPEAAIEALLLA